jgi:hypothetical protein
MGEGPQVTFLHGILGLAIVALVAARDAIEPLVLFLHDGAKRPALAGHGEADQFGVIQPGRNSKGTPAL